MRRADIQTDPEFVLNDIELLLRKGQGPCLSLLVNLEGDHTDHIRVRSAIKKAQDLQDIHSIQFATGDSVSERLGFRAASFDPGLKHAAVGMFISSDMDCIINFPFKVNEGVIIADSFEVRDVLYLRQYMDPYFVLSLSHRTITLHKGHGEHLKEVHDEIFPIEYQDDHEYGRSVRGTSYGFASKGFENDRSTIVDERLHGPIHTAALQASKYLGNDGQLIVVGAAKLASNLKDSVVARNIIAIHPGTLGGSNFAHISNVVWQECVAARRREILNEITRLTDLGLLYRAVGIRNVWNAASQGKGRVLFVEKDYQRKAYLLESRSSIRLHPPKEKYTTLEDAVDDVIEKVLQMGGKVIFAEPGDLKMFQNIALSLRYA